LAVNPDWLRFLATYFPKQVENNKVVDIQTFQKELANFCAPPNAAALSRIDASHYTPVNAPKAREETEFALDDLEWDFAANSRLAELL
jgi:hypothetical protein